MPGCGAMPMPIPTSKRQFRFEQRQLVGSKAKENKTQRNATQRNTKLSKAELHSEMQNKNACERDMAKGAHSVLKFVRLIRVTDSSPYLAGPWVHPFVRALAASSPMLPAGPPSAAACLACRRPSPSPSLEVASLSVQVCMYVGTLVHGCKCLRVTKHVRMRVRVDMGVPSLTRTPPMPKTHARQADHSHTS